MVTIEYNTEKIEVPESWHEVKLRAYEKYYTERPQSVKDKVLLVARICEIDEAKLMAWPADVFNIIAEKTAFIFKEHRVDPSPSIKIDGVTYVIPIEEKLSLGAYIDADEAIKAGERWSIELFFKYFFALPKSTTDITSGGERIQQNIIHLGSGIDPNE